MEPRSVVEQAVEWLRDHLAEEISIEEMAEGSGVTPFHFLRTFRHWTGVTPALYLSALRLEEAKRLLLTTDRSVTDICFDVGYNSLGTFTTRFTQLVGLSPTRLRQLGTGFRLDGLAGAVEHLGSAAGSGQAPRTTTIGGSLFAAEPPSGVIFLGLFGHPLPQQRPFACTLLSAPGEFRLRAPKPGRYYLFAACFAPTLDPVDFLLSSRAVRQVGSAGPFQLRAGDGPVEAVKMRMRPMTALDPPLLVALPLLVAERRARTTLRESGDVIRLASAPA